MDLMQSFSRFVGSVAPAAIHEVENERHMTTFLCVVSRENGDMRAADVDADIWEVQEMERVHLIVPRVTGGMILTPITAFVLHPNRQDVPGIVVADLAVRS
jgi:hypothetical protein